ncbi:TraB/GumN family protein [Roseibacterium beibuensis]|uniref:TraB/GumN family protein n=1 Tax=[Roseibacterium] beibuensis TaxID=1193142 RepID=UPI00217DBFD3|nr:TraB/GumN family protein [Roseibacterium beibuensis]MCS6627415.1 TraB/GumN family protein [Roseibacterium beibuensis]
MTFKKRLKTTVSTLGRLTAGAVLGLGLAAAVMSPAHAQVVTPPVAEEAPAIRAVPPAEGDGPALWVIKDADSTLYLFGTVHLLRPTTGWGTQRIDAAFDSADKLVLEISNPDDQAALVPLVMQHGMSPATPLSSLLTAEEVAALDEAAKTIGLSAAQMDPFRPWFAALTLSLAPLQKAGYDPTSGVELILKARAEAAGKPISGFETVDEQIRILAGFPEDVQLAFLRSTLEAVEDASVELDRLVEAWAAGDVEAIEALGVDQMREASDEIYQALLVRRNTNWAGQIQTMLEGSGTAFIAVGAAHLAGDDSVQEILEQRGVEVEVAP